MIQRNLMISGIRWSKKKDFDNPKVYGDISISDGLVSQEVIPYIKQLATLTEFQREDEKK